MNTYNYHSSLRIWHPNMDPDVICSAINMAAKYSNRAGEQRKTPKGKVLQGKYKETYCSFPLDSSSNVLLEDAIKKHSADFTKHLKFLKKVLDTGGRISYFVGLYIDGNVGLSLPYEILKEISDLGIGLDLDIYPSD